MAGCGAGCKEEFKASNFLLGNVDPLQFVRPQCRCGRGGDLFYLAYRLLIAAYFVAMVVLQWLEVVELEDHPAIWLVYLSNWTFLVLTIDVILQCVLAFYACSLYMKKGKVWDDVFPYMPWYLKMSWVITNVSTNAGFIVTIFYWLYLFEAPLSFSNLNSHGVNSGYLIINFFITGVPVRIYHVFHTYIYLICYTAFGLIYELVYKQAPAYGDFLNWSKNLIGSIYVTLILVFGMTTATWLVYYAMYRIRLAIFQSCQKQDVKPKANAKPAWTNLPLETQEANTSDGLDWPLAKFANKSSMKNNGGVSAVDSGIGGVNSGIGNVNSGIGNGNSGIGNGNFGIGNGNSRIGNGNSGIGNGNYGIGNGNSGIGNGNSGVDNPAYHVSTIYVPG